MRTVPRALLAVSWLAACTFDDAALEGAPAADGASVLAPRNRPGKWVHTPTVDGIRRELIVYVPQRAAAETAAPVVFMFHGTSGDGEKLFDISGWREKADETGLIAVFPSALTYCLKEDDNRDGDFDDRGERKVTTKWAAGKLGDPTRMPLCSPEELALLPPEKRALADHPLIDDVAFTRAMLDLLSARYAVDPRRTYVSGFSNGAAFAARLVLELSDRFAAAGVAAGSLDLAPRPARPMSVIHFFGNEDPKLSAEPLPMDEGLLEAHPEIHERAIAPFLTMLRLEDRHVFQERPFADRRAIAFTYAASTVGASNRYRYVLFEGLGHQYPNGRNYPIAAADFLWELFRAQSL